MSELISALFALRDFCLFAIVVFFEVPLVLSFQGKNEKKNFNLDILNRCQPAKFEFDIVYLIGERGISRQAFPDGRTRIAGGSVLIRGKVSLCTCFEPNLKLIPGDKV